MRKALIIGLLALVLTLSINIASTEAEIVDRIVAVVNGDIITLQEVDLRLKAFLKQKPTQDRTQINQIRRQILEMLIERKLLQQENKKLGITVSDNEVDRALERFKKLNSVTQEEFEANLDRLSMTLAMFKSDLYGQLNKMKLINQEMRPRIIISNEQIETYYQAHSKDFIHEDKVHIRNILLKLPLGASESAVQEKITRAQEISAKIKAGQDFTDAAREYSEGSNAAAGGDMGLVAWNEMAPAIKEALKNLKDGQVTHPIRLGQTIQILQVVTRYGSDEKAVIQAKRRIQEILITLELEKKYNEWLRETRTKSIIKIKL
ncbi:MAG: SurA N-terminal domain-containing protein [Deltaproteobacteria bacterium]|nr:SurA N-terminal domain-containing protein [Deltaproteobacteria bacterium]MBW2085255.1 SurA N-terminal domain-containing protein [Deltaproteobacteria bacterium]